VREALARAEITLTDGDVIVVPSKVVSRAEDRFVDLSTVDPSERARELAETTGKDARLVELTLREAASVSRVARHALIVRHRLGFVTADAGIDLSNATPPGRDGGTWAILLPLDPDASARRLREALAPAAVVISDSFGRPFRIGTVGAAIGCAGLPPLWDQRGRKDLGGRTLERTITALADQVAAAADLVAGQADEARGAVLVRGLSFDPSDDGAGPLTRRSGEDLYA
jgi:coenzyme F420-0:L-glutamate ligase/coenzyme F420-1:gamma-L-glutamate ligase